MNKKINLVCATLTILLCSYTLYGHAKMHDALGGQVTGRSVVLTWTPSVDGGVVSVYRASAACSTTPTNFSQIAGGLIPATYTDATVTVGNYCYQVTTVVNGVESKPSNQFSAAVLPQPPSPPTNLTGTVN